MLTQHLSRNGRFVGKYYFNDTTDKWLNDAPGNIGKNILNRKEIETSFSLPLRITYSSSNFILLRHQDFSVPGLKCWINWANVSTSN